MPTAPAVFLGVQPGFRHMPAIELFNLTSAMGELPAGATVSRQTLERHGFRAPPRTLAGSVAASQQRAHLRQPSLA